MNTEMKEFERLKLLRRKRERSEREAQRKENNHWCFVAGTLVAEYLKTDLDISVYSGKGAAAKNKASFEPLENILVYLSTHKDFTAKIAAGARDPPDFH